MYFTEYSFGFAALFITLIIGKIAHLLINDN